MPQPQKNHFVFLIHGLAGDRRVFGHMPKALSNILKVKKPSTQFVIQNIEYDTGNDNKTAYDFAQDIHKVIRKSLDPNRMDISTKFSFIMHSQGGLVGAIWLFQSMISSPGYGTPTVVKHMDCFITIGSPFWGAKTAQWGRELKSLARKLDIPIPVPIGQKELDNMAFGSDMIFDFRMALIEENFQAIIDKLKSHVRFLNIVGVADILNPLGVFISGTNKYEDDGAVPLASARLNFLYSQSILSDYQHQQITSSKHVKELNLAPYVVVNAIHQTLLPDIENFSGIAQIPKQCVKNPQHPHPTFPYLWQHLIGESIEQIDQELGDFKTFLLDINIRLPDNYSYSGQDIQIKLLRKDGSDLKHSNIQLQKFYELYAHGRRLSEKYPHHVRFYFTGSIKRTLAERNEIILIRATGPGLKSRDIEMIVRPTYSSFVDINLCTI